MKRTCVLPMILALAACGKAAPMDPVDSLAANPDRLKEVMPLCQEGHAKLGDATRNAASIDREFSIEDAAPLVPNGQAQCTSARMSLL